jgi:uncharacterized protein (TIGR02284 family)
MENNKETIETLNDLILINNDRIAGYERALKEIEEGNSDESLEAMFLEFVDQSRRFRNQLGAEIEVLGSDIPSGTSTGGKLHRTWLELKASVSGHSPKSILEECEFGEDAIQKTYESALEEKHLPGYIKEILKDQESYLLEAHDEVKSLRDSA